MSHYPKIVLRTFELTLALAILTTVVPSATAATAPSLGSLASSAFVASTFTNNSAQTVVTGDACFTTGPSTAYTLNGTQTVPCAPQAGTDQGLALTDLLGQPCTSLGAGAIALDSVTIGTNPPGVIPPGCYASGGAMNITASTLVRLSGAGVYVFRPGGALNTGADSIVALANGACAANVFWAPVGVTTLGANASLPSLPTFMGTIIDAAGITIGNFANLGGKALAFGGTVTTAAVTIGPGGCAPRDPIVVAPGIPTLSSWGLIALMVALVLAAFAALRRRFS